MMFMPKTMVVEPEWGLQTALALYYTYYLVYKLVVLLHRISLDDVI